MSVAAPPLLAGWCCEGELWSPSLGARGPCRSCLVACPGFAFLCAASPRRALAPCPLGPLLPAAPSPFFSFPSFFLLFFSLPSFLFPFFLRASSSRVCLASALFPAILPLALPFSFPRPFWPATSCGVGLLLFPPYPAWFRRSRRRVATTAPVRLLRAVPLYSLRGRLRHEQQQLLLFECSPGQCVVYKNNGRCRDICPSNSQQFLVILNSSQASLL